MRLRSFHSLALLCLTFLVMQSAALRESQAGRSAQVRRAQGKVQASSAAKKSMIRSHRAARPRAGGGLHATTRAKSSLGKRATAFGKSRQSPALSGSKGSIAKKLSAKNKRNASAKNKRNASAKNKRNASAKTRTSARSKRAASPGRARPQRMAQRVSKALSKVLARAKALPLVQRIGKRLASISAATTRKLDRLQARAPPWLAKTMSGLRTYSIVSLAAFNLTYLNRDAKFLGTFFAANAVFSYAILPGAISFGLSPLTSTVLNALSTPITALVLVMRDVQLKRRAGESTTMAQSAKSILRDYKAFASERQAAKSKRALAMGPR